MTQRLTGITIGYAVSAKLRILGVRHWAALTDEGKLR